MLNDPILFNEYRGDIPDTCVRGRICIVSDRMSPIYTVGDPDTYTYFRSSSKPVQALPMMVRGLHERFSFSPLETAMMAGSHAGQSVHSDAIYSMLHKASLNEEDFVFDPCYPFIQSRRDELVRSNLPPRRIYHNCSGKHVSLMCLNRELSGSFTGYHLSESPAEREVLRTISMFSGCPEENVRIGIDGCGVPVFAVPLTGIARAMLRMACPELIPDDTYARAASEMTHCISLHPVVMRGDGFICTELNRDPNILAKGGARGVYAFALRKERVGIAFKTEDGSEEIWPLVVAAVLKHLNYNNEETLLRLSKLHSGEVKNDLKDIVGTFRAVF